MMRLLARLIRLGFWMRSLALIAPLLVLGQAWQANHGSPARRAAQIGALSDLAAARQIERLVPADASAVRVLVELMASERPAISSRAREVLYDEFDRWRRLPQNQLVAHWDSLAQALAARVGAFGPLERDCAVDLTQAILRTSQRQRLDLSHATVNACERVLRSTWRSAEMPIRRDTTTTRTSGYLSLAKREGLLPPHSGAALSPADDLPTLPYAGPPPLRRISGATPDSSLAATDEVAWAEATHLQETDPADDSAPGPLSLRAIRDARPLSSGLMQASQSSQASGLSAPEFRQTASAGPPRENVAYGAPNDPLLQLVQRLNHPDPQVQRDTEAELALRGFGRAQIELGRQLTSPALADRRHLVDRLARVRGIDLSTWLFWLARDNDAQVRHAALGMLATLRDPEIVDQVQRLSADDADEQVRALGERIRESRAGRAR